MGQTVQTRNTPLSIYMIALLFSLISLSSAAYPLDAVQTVAQFSAAIKSGDEAALRSTLHDQVLIFESGNVESSLTEYAAHHMAADMAYMAEVETELLSRSVFEEGDMAVVSSHYRMSGQAQGRPVNRTSSETLVLRRTDDVWKIVHIHWS